MLELIKQDKVEQLNYLKDLKNKGELYGMFRDIHNDVYHDSQCPGLSSSKLKIINDSMYAYLQSTYKSSAAMEFGSAFHDCVLTPEYFDSQYVAAPLGDRRTKEGKQAYCDFMKIHENCTVIDKESYDKILAMDEQIRSNSACEILLSSGEPEQAFWWADEESGILCKCKADWIYTNGDHRIVVDLKTTSRGVGEKEFASSIVTYGYDLSAAFYIDGINKCLRTNMKEFSFIVIEKEPPYEIGLYVLSERAIERGRCLYKKALQKYATYIKNPYNIIAEKEFTTIDLPAWAYKD